MQEYIAHAKNQIYDKEYRDRRNINNITLNKDSKYISDRRH